MQTKSRHNITGKLKSGDYFIVNPLYGQADILTREAYAEYVKGVLKDPSEWIKKGYLADPEKEKAAYNNAYLDFLDARAKEELQIFFVPRYSCDFGCSYCYQEGYSAPPAPPFKDVARAFFRYVKNEFAGRKKYITLFGGEPLAEGKRSREEFSYFLSAAKEANIALAVVTNGYRLAEYLPLMEGVKIREIQVTLDGPEALHDVRRPGPGGKPTFKKISEGIDKALAAGHIINLRTVLDRDNNSALPELAAYAVKKGWTKNPKFKTQLGRNYELHTCQEGRDKLLSRLELHGALSEMIREHPAFLEYHRPAFSISRYLFDNGQMPLPLFDSCPGTKTEWAFDYAGRIYACTATVGKKGSELGAFYPEVASYLYEDKIEEWRSRDVTEIEECVKCPQALACGGGCAAVACNATDKLKSPDCRPIPELIGLGLDLYYSNSRESGVERRESQ